MRIIAAIALLVLAGCNSRSPELQAAQKAADRYAFIKRNGATTAELCEAATEAKDAWSRTANADDYRIWRDTATADCIEDRLRQSD